MLPRPSARRHRMLTERELQITAFLNLMVILVPFLLVTAVFARIAAIELTLPMESSVSQQEEKDTSVRKLKLIISITEEEISVLNDTISLGVFKRGEKGYYDTFRFPDLLAQLKEKYPEENGAVILSKPYIAYKTLIDTIDTVREEFPDISLGEL